MRPIASVLPPARYRRSSTNRRRFPAHKPTASYTINQVTLLSTGSVSWIMSGRIEEAKGVESRRSRRHRRNSNHSNFRGHPKHRHNNHNPQIFTPNSLGLLLLTLVTRRPYRNCSLVHRVRNVFSNTCDPDPNIVCPALAFLRRDRVVDNSTRNKGGHCDVASTKHLSLDSRTVTLRNIQVHVSIDGHSLHKRSHPTRVRRTIRGLHRTLRLRRKH